MTENYEKFRELKCEVLAVSFAPPEKVASFVAKYPLPFPALSDPERKAYAQFSLDRTTWKDILQPAVIGRYLKLMWKGWMPKKSDKDDDLLQLGGDFVLNEERNVIFSYRSVDPTDRPAVADVLDAVKNARE